MKKLFALAIAALAASLLFVGCEKLGGGSVDTSQLEGTWIATSVSVSVLKDGKAVNAKTFLNDMCSVMGVNPKDIDAETAAYINEIFSELSETEEVNGGSLTFMDGKVIMQSADEYGDIYSEEGSYILDGHKLTLLFEDESIPMEIAKLTSKELSLKMAVSLSDVEGSNAFLPGYSVESYLNFKK